MSIAESPRGRRASDCSGCGAALPAGVPAGLCPRCTLRDALAVGGWRGSHAGPDREKPVADDLGEGRAGQPRRLGDYELLEEIARGGMGVVYRARQRSLNRTVAVKTLRLGLHADPDLMRRFQLEAAAAGGLRHPNIVAIHEIGLHEGQHFLVMDYVAGPNLAGLIRDQPLLPGRAARYLRRIADAVHHAHERGILHRDLKASNVLIDADDQPRITDFGLAKRLDSDELELTRPGQILGSPNYLSPEQAAGQVEKVGPPSDVYSLGAMLYQVLTGRPPFTAGSVAEVLRLVREQEPVPPRLLNPSVPRDLETICLKCLEKEPHRRYPTARELGEELERFLADRPIRARPVRAPERVWRWSRRNRLASCLMAALAGALLVTLRLKDIVDDERSLLYEREREFAYLFRRSLDRTHEMLDGLWAIPDRKHLTVTSEEMAAIAERPRELSPPRLPGPDPLPPLVLGVTAEEHPVARVYQHAELCRRLEEAGTERLGRPVRVDLRIYKFHEDLLADLRDGEVDFGRIGTLRYLRSREAGSGLVRLVVPVSGHKNGVLFTRSDNPIRSWEEVRGRRLALGDTNATISFRAQIELLRRGIAAGDLGGYAHLDATQDFVDDVRARGLSKVRGDIGSLHSHLEVIRGVLECRFDVGVANRSVFFEQAWNGLTMVPGTEFESSRTLMAASPMLSSGMVRLLTEIFCSFEGVWLERLPEATTAFREVGPEEFALEEEWFSRVQALFPPVGEVEDPSQVPPQP